MATETFVGKIYKIVSDQTDDIYYGSTKQPLCKRLYDHRNHYKRYTNGTFNYVSSFEIVKYNDCQIFLVEQIDECRSKEELHARERYYIENFESVNIQHPNRTDKEYYQDNKEKIKEYYQDNKDRIIKRQKEHYQDNKDRIIKKVKEYRQKNKEKISKKYDCDCGGRYVYSSRARHFKTIKHKNYINYLYFN